MTKFIDNITVEVEKEINETKFKFVVNDNKNVTPTVVKPKDYDNVEWLGYNLVHGDVFKCWDDCDYNNFDIVFGEKGDEF